MGRMRRETKAVVTLIRASIPNHYDCDEMGSLHVTLKGKRSYMKNL
jgi:hypothetical protein